MDDTQHSPATGAASLQPGADTPSSTINVSPLARQAAATPVVSAPMPAPAPSPTPADQPWSAPSKGIFANPRSILLFSLFGLVVAILFLTFGISVNVWLKLVILLVVSAGGTISALQAYDADNDALILLGLIISTIILVGTLIIGSTYLYYDYKLHSLKNSLQNSYSAP